ncbi:glycosyltransferase family 4 protein [Onishia taeanensis]
MTRLRSLFVIPRYWPAMGGSELHTRALAQHLAPHADVRVLCHHSENATTNEQAAARAHSQRCRDGDVDVHQAAPSGIARPLLGAMAHCHPHSRAVRPLYDRLFRLSTRDALREACQDRQLVHAVYNGMTGVAETAADAAKRQDIPFVWTPLAHTHAPEGTAWSSPRFRRLYARADALIAMTEYERDWLIARGAAPSRTHVCPVGPLLTGPDAASDPADFRRRHRLGEAPVVLFLGRHAETKGYRQLTEAAPQVWARHPDTRFLFIGPQTPASRRFFACHADPRLLVIDSIDEAGKNAALDACDLLCVPSTQESLGVTYLEAWHYGKPVIGADIEVLRTVIHHGEDGLLADQAPAPLAEAINALVDDPARRQRLGSSGQRKVEGRYRWSRLASELAGIYRGVLEGQPSPTMTSRLEQTP